VVVGHQARGAEVVGVELVDGEQLLPQDGQARLPHQGLRLGDDRGVGQTVAGIHEQQER
jgi:hypothetical protein